MKTKVLVLGGSGMLGSMLVSYLSKNIEIDLTATIRDNDPEALFRKAFPNVRVVEFDAHSHMSGKLIPKPDLDVYDYIINCIGTIKPYIGVDSKSIMNAIQINSIFPYFLREKYHGTIIQIATDCVYSGNRSIYSDSPHDAADIYGKSKSLGEINSKNNILIRTSIIGPELEYKEGKTSLLEWFLNLPYNHTCTGFTNHLWNGITTLAFAKICEAIIMGASQGEINTMVPMSTTNKYELLKAFAYTFGRNDIIINKGEAQTRCDRVLPPSMDGEKLWLYAGYRRVPSISELIRELKEYIYEGSYYPGYQTRNYTTLKAD